MHYLQKSKLSAYDPILKAIMCILCIDLVQAIKDLDKFKNLDFAFESTKEYKFLNALVLACSKSDENSFNALWWDQQNMIDSWKTNVLAKIKNEHFQEKMI